MKSDILNRPDLRKVIVSFYEKISSERELSPFFSHLSAEQWAQHVHLMCDFWENVLFYTGEYAGDPLKTHKEINAVTPTNASHFEIWLTLFDQTVDSLYAGENATKMKVKARSIANIMLKKVGNP